jgi:hypothetical protein
VELGVEEAWQKGAEADETSERDDVHHVKDPAIPIPKAGDVLPSGKRISARVGTDTINPVFAALRWKASEMKGPMAPFKTQMAKEKSK